MSEYLLEIDGVDKSFPGVRALANMQLNVRPGEVLALVGENGAGKSTLMKLLSGIYVPDAGTFRIGGNTVDISGPKHAQELGVSIIHQEFNLMRDLTVAQNIFLGREPMRGPFINDSALNRQARELFDRIGVDLNPVQQVAELTVAKQQMVEIAKALSFDAKLLILDEPTAALNDAEVETLHRIIRRFITPETGAIYISHRMDELKVISDRITVIRDGEYVDTLDTETTTMPEVISLMVGREVSGTDRPATIPAGRETRLEVRNLSTKELLNDISFSIAKGEILGFAGLMGAGRTEVARAIVGADKMSSGTIILNGQTVSIPNPARAAQLRIGYLSEDRKHLGLMLEADVAQNIMLSLPERDQQVRFHQRTHAQVHRRGTGRTVADQDAVDPPGGQEPLRRQPAKDRDRQVAGQGLRRADLRRTNARHRRRRQGRDLPPAQRTCRQRQVDHHDLLGTAGSLAHVASHRGDVGGPNHRIPGQRRGHPGTNHGTCHAE